ncbi:SAM-dependent methyltransferase [Anabaena azotica]|uniref:SAM-dependent methyltransferase n=1 Tax=Anabaena azotica FACHB-119 TaxID=947527 RepID=A0ABR8D6L6_9NOST|nr:SAM-dependent methyltransferase [Anabaena azotica]MBD2502784.1 SAM-dependent methyltransferase [Anabaena azotica FACHB-119]
MKFHEVVPWGRNLAEYKLMFNLSDADLNNKILGCGDGPASFNAEMAKLGHLVVSIDPIYQFSSEQIKKRVQEIYELVTSHIKTNAHRYVWKNFHNVDELGQARLATMEKFFLDYEVGKTEGRYLVQSLPNLKFFDDQFDLCLCSHLLFLYSEQLPLEFHIASIHELLRTAQEVRIFPLLNLEGELSPYVEPVIQELTSNGFNVQIQSVAYEFQKDGNQMLKIIRRHS